MKFRVINVLLKIASRGAVPGEGEKSPAVGSLGPRVIWKRSETPVLTGCMTLSSCILHLYSLISTSVKCELFPMRSPLVCDCEGLMK